MYRMAAARTGPRQPIRWTRELDSLLGTKSDAELAADLGIGRQAVSVRRRALGIPAFRSQVHRAKTQPCVICGDEFKTGGRQFTTCSARCAQYQADRRILRAQPNMRDPWKVPGMHFLMD